MLDVSVMRNIRACFAMPLVVLWIFLYCWRDRS